MKTSRSKLIELTITLTLCILVVVYIVLLSNSNTDISKSYVYKKINEKEIIKEEIEDLKLSSIDEIEVPNVQQQEIVEEPVIVYDNMTMEELSNKLNNSLSSDISGYGNFIASYSLEKGVDPYLATAIILHETGCTWGCSSLVKNCNNVGGMKGSGCGAYGHFNTLEEGIQKFIDNIYNNYYAYGLTNAYLMGNKYAEDPGWATKVNGYIEKIKNR